MSLLAKAALLEFDGDAFRNIVSLRVSENLFDDLTDDPALQRIALEHERRTKPAAYGEGRPIIDRPFQEADWIAAIGFPFAHWSASRYSDGGFGVWYGADSIQCAVRETVWHWKRGLLADAGFDCAGVAQHRRVFAVRLATMLIDMRSLVGEHPELVDPHSYAATQPLGALLRRQGHPGLASRSARGPGDVYIVFNPGGLSAPRQMCDLTYRVQADGSVTVERTLGRIGWVIR